MAAFPRDVKKKILDRDRGKCVICGRQYPHPDAVHVIDPADWKNQKNQRVAQQLINGITLCPNCHQAFDDHLRPHLHKALTAFGVKKLPKSWETSNKLTTSKGTKQK